MPTIDRRLEKLEDELERQDRDRPGLYMRVDRLEKLGSYVVILGGVALAWRVLDVVAAWLGALATGALK